MLDAMQRRIVFVVMFYCASIQANNKSCGCGQNPIRTLQSASQTLGILNMKDAMNLIESDRETWGQFLGLLQAYDDCIRTRGGVRFRKRSQWTNNADMKLEGSLENGVKKSLVRLMKLQDASKNSNEDEQRKFHSIVME